MQLQDALREFLVQLDADGRSPHTIAQYRRHVGLFARWWADVGRGAEIEIVGTKHMAAFLAADVAKTRANGGIRKATSANALRTSLRCFFGYCHAAGLIAGNPTRLVRRALCGNPLPKTLTTEEAARLLDATAADTSVEGRRDHALATLLLGAGLRIGSALGVDIEDVDLERREVRLRGAKGNRDERVLLPVSVCDVLRAWIAQKSSGPLFPAPDGRPISKRHAQRRVAGWAAKAEILRPVSPHALRHTFATRLYARTHDIFVVKTALRHRSITSTLVYAAMEEGRLRQALDA